jgi:hypothetical protein
MDRRGIVTLISRGRHEAEGRRAHGPNLYGAFGALSAEIRQKMSVAMFALLMTAVTGITCFPYTLILAITVP